MEFHYVEWTDVKPVLFSFTFATGFCPGTYILYNLDNVKSLNFLEFLFVTNSLTLKDLPRRTSLILETIFPILFQTEKNGFKSS